MCIAGFSVVARILCELRFEVAFDTCVLLAFVVVGAILELHAYANPWQDCLMPANGFGTADEIVVALSSQRFLVQ